MKTRRAPAVQPGPADFSSAVRRRTRRWHGHGGSTPIGKPNYKPGTRPTGQGLRTTWKAGWSSLARAAARNQQLDGLSRRLDSDLEDIQADRVAGWRHSWRQWRAEPWLSKIKGILHVLTKREPPWELWEGERLFSSVASSFNCRIGTTYKVDRLSERINFIWFTGLPGSGAAD